MLNLRPAKIDEENREMPYSYKDLTYIRVALQVYESQLIKVDEADCEADEFSESQDDLMYLQRLMAITNSEIDTLEQAGPSLHPVK